MTLFKLIKGVLISMKKLRHIGFKLFNLRIIYTHSNVFGMILIETGDLLNKKLC